MLGFDLFNVGRIKWFGGGREFGNLSDL